MKRLMKCAAAVVLLASLVSGCGSDSGDGQVDAAGAKTSEEAVRSMVAAIADGEFATACGLFTKKYADEWVLLAAKESGEELGCEDAVAYEIARQEEDGGMSPDYSDEIVTTGLWLDTPNEQFVEVIWKNDDDSAMWAVDRVDGSWFINGDHHDLL